MPDHARTADMESGEEDDEPMSRSIGFGGQVRIFMFVQEWGKRNEGL